MKRFTAILASIALAIGFAAPVQALDWTCNTSYEGQVRIRFFDLSNKVNAIYTTCALPNIPGVTGEGFALPSSANNKANSIAIRTAPNVQGNKYIAIWFYDSQYGVNFIESTVVYENQDVWFNLPDSVDNRISSFEVFYYN